MLTHIDITTLIYTKFYFRCNHPGNAEKCGKIVKKSHSDSKNNVLGLYAGYERDRNISFCSPLVLNHAKVTAEGFCDNLKNGPEMEASC